MRIAGASTTSAPSSRSRAASALACARARVTATRAPVQRPRSQPGERRRAAPPRRRPRVIAGAPDARRLRALGDRRAACARTVRWPGSVPRSTTAAGSSAGAPGGDQRCGDRAAARARPCRRRACRGSAASASQSSALRLAGSSWPVTNATALASSRWVTGMPGVGGRGDARGDAGHDLERDARRAQRLRLLAAAAEHERVAALQPHDAARRARPCSTSSRSISSCGTCGAAAAPCPRRSARRRRGRRRARPAGSGGRGGSRRPRAISSSARTREQARVAGAGADEVDGHCSAAASAAQELAPRQQRARPPRPSARGSRRLARSRTQAEPSGRPGEAAHARPSPSVARRRRVAAAPSARDRGALGAQRRVRRGMVGGRRRVRRRAARAPCSASTPWPGAGHERVERARAGRRGPSRSRPAAASTSASTSPAASLRRRVSTLPRSSTHVQVGRARPAAARAGAARWCRRARPRGTASSEAAPTSASRGVRARAAGHDRSAGRELARHVLGRVHGEVDLAREQRGLERARSSATCRRARGRRRRRS